MFNFPFNGNLHHLPFRSIISNINTSSYNLAKFLSRLLSLLRESDHNVRSNKDFIQIIKRVLGDIFIIELEKAILPKLTESIKCWKRYVDDRISFVKLGTLNHIITKLNSFDKNIEFTFEEEDKGKLPFLDAFAACHSFCYNQFIFFIE